MFTCKKPEDIFTKEDVVGMNYMFLIFARVVVVSGLSWVISYILSHVTGRYRHPRHRYISWSIPSFYKTFLILSCYFYYVYNFTSYC